MTILHRRFHHSDPAPPHAHVRLCLCLLMAGVIVELAIPVPVAAATAASVNTTGVASDFFYHTDDLYNVMAITDDTGTVADGGNERYEYADYGQPVDIFTIAKIIGNPSAIGNSYLFTGRRLDVETGWYYYRTRYLDPVAGRFTTRDTIGIWGDGGNRGNGYGYVGSNPFSISDPLGAGRGTGTPNPTPWKETSTEGPLECNEDTGGEWKWVTAERTVYDTMWVPAHRANPGTILAEVQDLLEDTVMEVDAIGNVVRNTLNLSSLRYAANRWFRRCTEYRRDAYYCYGYCDPETGEARWMWTYEGTLRARICGSWLQSSQSPRIDIMPGSNITPAEIYRSITAVIEAAGGG